jgi:hypothetical protein
MHWRISNHRYSTESRTQNLLTSLSWGRGVIAGVGTTAILPVLLTHTHTHASTRTHTHTRTHTRTQARTHTHTRTQARTHTHAHAHTRTHTHAHTHTHAGTHAHTHTHTHTRTHAHTHAHTHTHTHTRSSLLPLLTSPHWVQDHNIPAKQKQHIRRRLSVRVLKLGLWHNLTVYAPVAKCKSEVSVWRWYKCKLVFSSH